jgi:hypothetical protein
MYALSIVAFLGFAVGTVFMVVSFFTPRFGFGAGKTKLGAFLQWLFISCGLVFVGVFAAVTSEQASQQSQTAAVTVEPAATTAAVQPQAALSPLTTVEALAKAKRVVSATSVEIGGKPAIEVVYNDPEPLSERLYAVTMFEELWKAMAAADPADRASSGGLVVNATTRVRDAFGNVETGRVFQIFVPAEAIERFNWQSRDTTLLANFAVVTEKNIVGRRIVAAWCDSRSSQTPYVFCTTGR